MNRRRKLHVSKGDGFDVAVNMEKRRHVSDNAANTFISCHSHWNEGCHFIFSSFLNDAKGVPL
jgi:2-polyprenyl-3-methyl-5-hydroxy-6-metoxy-1,4-benzoquinol methylase